jgi:hypothetical protein
MSESLMATQRGEGPTLFDTIVDIIRAHGQAEPKVTVCCSNWSSRAVKR